MARVTGDGLGFSRRDFVVKGAAAGAALAASSVAGTGSADAMRGGRVGRPIWLWSTATSLRWTRTTRSQGRSNHRRTDHGDHASRGE